ncbi:MAG: hypothetical protein QOC78_1035, partial [Solirubrobacteraceae bacterium]|nr:hypothetical protein [Solirubrobacteraceae bacterium]
LMKYPGGVVFVMGGFAIAGGIIILHTNPI